MNIYTVVKAGCLVIYALGLASVAGLLPASWAIFAKIAAIFLIAHVLETIVMFKHVKRYQGPLAMSVLLSLTFGAAHWRPLMVKAQAAQ